MKSSRFTRPPLNRYQPMGRLIQGMRASFLALAKLRAEVVSLDSKEIPDEIGAAAIDERGSSPNAPIRLEVPRVRRDRLGTPTS